MSAKNKALKKKKGHIYERTIRGGFEKVRENATEQDYQKHYSAKMKLGENKGKNRYELR